MKHTDAEYLAFDPLEGDEAELTCRSVKLVTTCKPHPCTGTDEPHDIAPGSRARHEKARVDGDFWGSFYTCLPCLDRALSECAEDGDDE
ncbi:MAG: hypothetical protein JWR74_2145 [Polaromonas sp.]|nr:hypothetical protein [Polaromonas sp.]